MRRNQRRGQRRAVVTFLATALLMLATLTALAADDITTGPPTDGTTDGTSVEPREPGGEVSVEGEIRTSSISFDRAATSAGVVYHFVYSGPGSVDFEYDDPRGCLVSFVGVTSTAMKYCAS